MARLSFFALLFRSVSHAEGMSFQEALLSCHRKAGRVVRLRRGLYAVIPPGADPEPYMVDHFLVAAKITAIVAREEPKKSKTA